MLDQALDDRQWLAALDAVFTFDDLVRFGDDAAMPDGAAGFGENGSL